MTVATPSSASMTYEPPRGNRLQDRLERPRTTLPLREAPPRLPDRELSPSSAAGVLRFKLRADLRPGDPRRLAIECGASAALYLCDLFITQVVFVGVHTREEL